MSAFGGLILTNRGKNLQSKAQSGVQLNYNRIALGDGELGSSSILDLNTLISERKSLNITKLKVLSGSKVVVGGVLSNQDITAGFYFREIGIFAQDPDLGEILYCYGNAGQLAEYIPAGGTDTIEKSIDIQTLVGNATNVTATINESLVYETPDGAQEKADLAESRAKAASAPFSHVGASGAAAHPNATGTVSGFMSNTHYTKLEGIQSGAQVNQSAFSNVKVGTTTVSADNATDTLEFVAGTNVVLTPDAMDDKITISLSSNIETTTGSQTKATTAETNAKDWVKSFGLGSAAKDITDANAATETGFYKITSVFTNLPSTSSHFLIHIKHFSNYAQQMAIQFGNNRTFMRYNNNNVWTSWTEIESTAGSQTKVNAATTAFGLGVEAISKDWNTIDKSGFYSGTTNGPNGVTNYSGVHIQMNPTYATQIVQRLGKTFTRNLENGTWGSWIEIETATGAQAKADAAKTAAIDWAKVYGLGSGKTLANATDLNTVTAPGFYYTDTAANGAEGLANGFLIVNKAAHVSGYAGQIMIPYVSGKMYTRTQNAGVWGAWVQLETTAGAKLQIEQDSYKVSKSGKDSNGVFTTVEHRRKSDNTLVRKSVLSGGTSPQYTTRTVTFYASNGTSVVKTDTFTLSYDADGDLISEV